MKTDLLASRHIGINEQDTAVMLRKIGVESLDELIDKTIPANIRLKEPLALTSPLTEYEFGKHIATLAGKNKLYTTYIGLGWYNTITPAVIQRNVFENPVWYTSYTPYQTEVSARNPRKRIIQRRTESIHADAAPGQQLRDERLRIFRQGEQHMLLIHLHVLIFHRDLLGALESFHRFLGELVRVHNQTSFRGFDFL